MRRVFAVAAVGAAILGLPAQASAGHAPASQDCVYGSIGERYRALGAEHGVLGPVVRCESDTRPRAGRYNDFAGGSIYWSPRTGAHEVHGAILGLWDVLGRENGVLGFPVSGENRIRNGGVYQRFERASGHAYWSPATGAHEVHGAIFGAYGSQGWETGRLGYPVTSENRTPTRQGAYNHFQGGSVYWSPATGAHIVEGAIRDAWARQGWEAGSLGFPISGEYTIQGGARISQFQGGFIEWTPGTGAVVTHTGGDTPAVAGCPVPSQGAVSPEQAADCVTRGWDAANAAVIAMYGTNAIAIELMDAISDGDIGPYVRGGCGRDEFPITFTSTGIECEVYFPPVPGDGMIHGVSMFLGIGDAGGRHYVEDVEFVG
ncbi:MAG: hypothetical protein M3P95_02040 [Actinomycetota bacterium]|nr:hypothetical protein [Actinomycetota bacterium]